MFICSESMPLHIFESTLDITILPYFLVPFFFGDALTITVDSCLDSHTPFPPDSSSATSWSASCMTLFAACCSLAVLPLPCIWGRSNRRSVRCLVRVSRSLSVRLEVSLPRLQKANVPKQSAVFSSWLKRLFYVWAKTTIINDAEVQDLDYLKNLDL